MVSSGRAAHPPVAAEEIPTKGGIGAGSSGTTDAPWPRNSERTPESYGKPPLLLTERQAARFLNCARLTVNQMVEEGVLQEVAWQGRQRYLLADLQKLVPVTPHLDGYISPVAPT